jgi:N-acetylmuramoyl-L-alanine amidase
MEYIILIIVGIVGLLFGAKRYFNNSNDGSIPFASSLEIIKEFIPVGNQNRPGTTINVTRITVHNTSNSSSGADAKSHSNLVRGSWPHSWHYTVDDSVIIQQLPINEKGFHAKSAANNSSIGIEICMHQGNNQNKANDNAAKLVAYLMNDLALGIDKVVTHNYWTGKNCPILLLNEWENFKGLVQSYYSSGVQPSLIEGRDLETGRVGILPDSEMCWRNDEAESS